MSFGARLRETFDRRGRLCVGIDPHGYLLREWGLTDDAAGLREFGLRVVEAAAPCVGIVKPQNAFFERHGSAGYAALEDVLAAARAAGLLVISDVKRVDIGTTVDAYGQAWLTPGAPLEADAMTISAFHGVGANDGPRSLALAAHKGLFVLAATSNPEAVLVQQATTERGISVAASIVEDVRSWNDDEHGLGSVGVVLGATVDLPAYGILPEMLAKTPILAPGFGHQGARYEEIPVIYGSAAANAIVSSSRGILSAGPDEIARAVRSETTALRSALAS
jgi:orotidine-5'-phosphate decarboxylase